MSGRLDITTTTAIRRALSEVPTLRKGLVLTLLFALIGTAVRITIPVAVQQLIDHDIIGNTTVDMSNVSQRVALLSSVIFVGIVGPAGDVDQARHQSRPGPFGPQGHDLQPSPPAVSPPRRGRASGNPGLAGHIGHHRHPGVHGLGRDGIRGRRIPGLVGDRRDGNIRVAPGGAGPVRSNPLRHLADLLSADPPAGARRRVRTGGHKHVEARRGHRRCCRGQGVWGRVGRQGQGGRVVRTSVRGRVPHSQAGGGAVLVGRGLHRADHRGGHRGRGSHSGSAGG